MQFRQKLPGPPCDDCSLLLNSVLMTKQPATEEEPRIFDILGS